MALGASEDSIKSLYTDRDGVVIGFIVSEVNSELEEKMHERHKVMEELVSTAQALSNTFGDPMLEFDLLLDQLDTKPSAIQVRVCVCVQLSECLRIELMDRLIRLSVELR